LPAALGPKHRVGLAKAGALVALTDIDEKAAQGNRAIIAREQSQNQASNPMRCHG